MNRVWLAAGVAVVNGHADQGQKWKSGIKSFPVGVKRVIISGDDSPELRRVVGSEISGFAGDDRRRLATDESFRQVMYMNCWGQG